MCTQATEWFQIGQGVGIGDITVTILDIKRGKVSLGISPEDVSVREIGKHEVCACRPGNIPRRGEGTAVGL